MHGDRTARLAVVDETADQRLDFAVEEKADAFGVAVEHGRAGVAANDVVGADKIKRGREVELVPSFLPARRQEESPLVIEAGGAIVQAVHRSLGRRESAFRVIAFLLAVRKAQGEGRVGVRALSKRRKTGFPELFAGALLD